MIKLMLIFIMLILITPTHIIFAEYIGCYERPISGSSTIYAKAHFINSFGETTAATSKEAKIIRAGQTSTFATISDASFLQVTDRAGWYWIPISISPTDTVDQYFVSYKGTYDGSVIYGGDSNFSLRMSGQCNILSSQAGQSIVTASDNTSAWNIKLNGTSYITSNGQYKGYYLYCFDTKREVIDSVNGVSDYIVIERGFPFPSNPVSVTCELMGN